ncbi:MAG: hypothetical protein E4G93_02950 [Dehalococcoidia bacterium]|nr:MAG: hypothetical protein E4G93_02950 [Dehalococcoidia bacterium]
METRSVIVQEVISPGSIRASDGQTYVLRGIPDTDEEFGNFAAARKLVEEALLNTEVFLYDETAKELPDLPGVEVEAFDGAGKAIAPRLAAQVAGALVNHPVR